MTSSAAEQPVVDEELRPLEGYLAILRTVYQFTLTGTVTDLQPFLESTFNKTKSHFSLGDFVFFIFSEPIKPFASSDHANRSPTILQNFRDAEGLLPQTVTYTDQNLYYPVACPPQVPLGVILISQVPDHTEPLDVLIHAILYAIETVHSRYVSSRMTKLWDAFAVDGSSPESGFQKIVEELYSAVSFFDPINVDDDNLVINQLLLVQDNPRWLRIRASRPRQFINIIVQIARSISGLALDADRKFLCINPNEDQFRDRYLNYTSIDFQEPTGPNRTIDVKCELVVPIRHHHRVVAVLNLESKTENGFSMLQIDHLVAYSQHIAVLVQMLENQWRILYEGPKLTHEATASYLEAYTKNLDHDVMTPMRTLDEAIGKLSDMVGAMESQADFNKIKGQIAVIEKERHRLEVQAEDVINRLGLLNEEDIDVRDLVDDTILVLKRVHRFDDELEFISLSNNVPSPNTIHAHGLVRAYLFQLLDNATRSLCRKRDLNRHFIGEIVVKFERMRRFNGAYYDEYGVIDIRDNGLGVTAKELTDLRKFNAGTRFRQDAGKGNALVAAYRYMKQQGGWLEIDSHEGEFFRVQLAFR
jgi:signal transduction histidine kinase